MSGTKLIILDDDPTGSQTVHGCLLLMQWDIETLSEAIDDGAPLFFILTNTRAMDAARATATTREVCRNLKRALAGKDLSPIFISRSDSTLRGHYPVETDVMAEELGPFDAHFIVPAFFEAGRITRDSTHYLQTDQRLVPVHETEFARDSVFPYHNSYLPAYVEEKTAGRIAANQVERFVRADLHRDIEARLMTLRGNACVVVDGETQTDLDLFAKSVKHAAERGKRFLFRSAASMITALAELPPQPLKREQIHQLARSRSGAVIAGSHVARTTAQLAELRKGANLEAIEIDVTVLPQQYATQLERAVSQAANAHTQGRDVLIFTSRGERVFADRGERLAFGEHVSQLLVEIVRRLPKSLGWLITKGGITSNDVLSKGLALRSARLLGQIVPGVSIIRCPPDSAFGELPVVIFPGNVGDDQSLAVAYRLLTNRVTAPVS